LEGRVYMTPLEGGERAELRVPAGESSETPARLIADDAVSYGTRVALLSDGRIALGTDTLARVPVAERATTAVVQPKPSAATTELASIVGEYGWDHDVLYLREK